MTPEREMEIRASVALTRYDRREPGDSPGEQIRDTLAALDAEREKVARLERERDEARDEVQRMLATASAEVGDDRGMETECPVDAIRAVVRSVVVERDELAAQLAALREATIGAMRCSCSLPADECEAMRALRPCLTASGPDVEAYTRRVQTEECELAIRIVAARKTSEIITGERAAAMDVGGKTPLRALVADCSAGALADVEDALRARARELRGGR